MVRIRAERFPFGIVGPFKVLKKIGPNAYDIDITPNYGISWIFNIENLVAYKGSTVMLDDHFNEQAPHGLILRPFLSLDPFPINLSPTYKESNDVILDMHIVFY
jgi:hypothetical protein